MQSTLQIFKYLYGSLPPLFDEEKLRQMKDKILLFESGAESVERVEDEMIRFGYEIWPWNQAYREYVKIAEEKIGEEFLFHSLSAFLQDKFLQLKKEGMCPADFYSGKCACYFDHDERYELSVALMQAKKNLKIFVDRELVGLKKKEYLSKVNEFKKILEKIKKHLNELNRIAEKESEHDMLADEIKSKVRAFEYGLCMLGPETKHEEVERAVDFFHGRRMDLNRMRGIHKTIQIDLYSNLEEV
jgi:hypothetical protein